MIAQNKSPLFQPGQILATPGALEALETTGQTVIEFLSRHLAGEWGEISIEDKALNDAALQDGSRLLSSYILKDGTKLWIISEAEDENGRRVATTALLPDEY